MKLVIKKLPPTTKKPRARWIHSEFYQTFKEEIIFLNLFQKIEEQRKLPSTL